ncbi:MAG: integrase [Betaproteobacteria bacterium RBG_19FT_COMBO_58_11]|nr:MAG: integrase [Betaproteobacteria bacterium RBG_19FT_COMBO_58_11]
MSKTEKRAYLDAIRGRYHKAKRADKSKILDEFCAVCGYHRKYALRRLNQASKRTEPRKPGRASRYACPEVMTPLRAIWLATDQMASKRLKAAMPLWLPHYEASYGNVADDVRHKLLTISAASIDRVLAPVRAAAGKRGLSGTKPGTLLKHQIPLQGEAWDVSLPGFIEADTVAHCGNSLAGDFAWSLTMTDLYSGWTECRATWNKGAEGVMTQIKAIQKALPFPIKGFDCDNGSEFLNWHLLRYFQNHKQPVKFTRSRPYHSNDNAHVEQKNWSCVRSLFGYERFSEPKLVDLMNDLYANEFSLLTNFFCPTMKLTEKKRVGSKIVKKHAAPETPAQRLLSHPELTKQQKERILATQKGLNPFALRDIIQKKLKAIFKLVR